MDEADDIEMQIEQTPPTIAAPPPAAPPQAAAPPVPAAEALPKAKDPQHFAGLLSPLVIDIASVAASTAIGLVTAWRITDERAYKNLTSLHLVEDIKDDRRLEGPTLWKKVSEGKLSRKEAYKEVQNAVFKYEGKMAERFSRVGVKDIFGELGVLRTHQKWEVALTALSTFAISVGTLFVVSRTLFAAKGTDKDAEPKLEAPPALPAPRPESFVQAVQQSAQADAAQPSLSV
ncbi:MAG: hypothetical protein SFX19_05575 [Alphaproteobacteria bacterium]|nr:hypothetical protein [Alphaproteobacteria bacterium]